MNMELLSEVTQDLIRAAKEVVNDFEIYGEVLQSNENGEYDNTTAIRKLQIALENMNG